MTRSRLFVIGISAVTLSTIISPPVSNQAKSQQVTTITLATYTSMGSPLDMLNSIAQRYMRLHSNIQIQIDPIPMSYNQKIMLDMASGTSPDIFQVNDSDIAVFVSKNMLTNLQNLLPGAHVNLNSYYTPILDTGIVSGKLYTLPYEWSDLAVYYNKTLFRQAHIPFPTSNWSWSDLAHDALKLTKRTSNRTTQWGVLLPGNWTRGVEPLISSYGGRLIGPTGNYVGYMNKPGTANALRFYQSMYANGSVPTPSILDSYPGVDFFQTGKVAMYITGIWPESVYKTTSIFIV